MYTEINVTTGEVIERPLTKDEQSDVDATNASIVKMERIAAIDAELTSIDIQKVRAISDALLTGDKTRLEQLETQAQGLRTERKGLM